MSPVTEMKLGPVHMVTFSPLSEMKKPGENFSIFFV